MATPKLPEGVPKQSQPEETHVRTPRSADVAGQIFAQLDTDGSGGITLDELRRGYEDGRLQLPGATASIEMNLLGGGRGQVSISAEAGIDLAVVIKTKIFTDWCAEVDKDPKLFIQDIRACTNGALCRPRADLRPLLRQTCSRWTCSGRAWASSSSARPPR